MCSWLPALHRFVSSPNLARWQLFNTKRAHCKNIHCHHPHPRHRHHHHDGQQRHPHHPHRPHPHYQNEQHCPHKLKSSSLALWAAALPTKRAWCKNPRKRSADELLTCHRWKIWNIRKISRDWKHNTIPSPYFLEIKLSYYHHHQQPPGNLD